MIDEEFIGWVMGGATVVYVVATFVFVYFMDKNAKEFKKSMKDSK